VHTESASRQQQGRSNHTQLTDLSTHGVTALDDTVSNATGSGGLEWPTGYTASSYNDLYTAARTQHSEQQPPQQQQQKQQLSFDPFGCNDDSSSSSSNSDNGTDSASYSTAAVPQPLAAVDTANGASLELLLAASRILAGPFTALSSSSSSGCCTVVIALSLLQDCAKMYASGSNQWGAQAVVHLQKELLAAAAGNAAQRLCEAELIEQWIAAQHKRARLAETVLDQVGLY
jgi:hypothetical protein